MNARSLSAALCFVVSLAGTLCDAATLELAPMRIALTLPVGWKVNASASTTPAATSPDGALRVLILHFPGQWLFEVANSEKLALHFAPALDDAAAMSEEKVVVNALVGSRMIGAGHIDGEAARFQALLIGDRANEGHTAVVIVCGVASAMDADQATVAAVLESVRPMGE
jgi:hypothetical protein